MAHEFMRGEDTILFVGVAALALSIVVSVVAPILRQKRTPSSRGRLVADPRDMAALLAGPSACPVCGRGWPASFRYCPLDGRALAGRDHPAAGNAEAEREEDDHDDDRAAAHPAPLAAATPFPGGKICPSCARRYRHEVAVCARDGAPLISVN